MMNHRYGKRKVEARSRMREMQVIGHDRGMGFVFFSDGDQIGGSFLGALTKVWGAFSGSLEARGRMFI
jgi:hypothetical protein